MLTYKMLITALQSSARFVVCYVTRSQDQDRQIQVGLACTDVKGTPNSATWRDAWTQQQLYCVHIN
jgi:hypothetical protein